MPTELSLRKPHFQDFASTGLASDSECLLKFCVLGGPLPHLSPDGIEYLNSIIKRALGEKFLKDLKD